MSDLTNALNILLLKLQLKAEMTFDHNVVVSFLRTVKWFIKEVQQIPNSISSPNVEDKIEKNDKILKFIIWRCKIFIKS